MKQTLHYEPTFSSIHAPRSSYDDFSFYILNVLSKI